jgi:hypothetical protein
MQRADTAEASRIVSFTLAWSALSGWRLTSPSEVGMLALVIICMVIVLLLGLLVIGLLRSHADILGALHSLGAGVGDVTAGRTAGALAVDTGGAPVAFARPDPDGPLVIGPRLAGERRSASANEVVGVSPDGEAVAIAAGGVEQQTLFAFLTSGCTSCARFWEALEDPWKLGLPAWVRPVIVTKGPELESPAALRGRATPAAVVMSTEAWADYEVPGAPFFALVDGPSSRRIGEGTARDFAQILSMVERARVDSRSSDGAGRAAGDGAGRAAGARSLRFDAADREREARNDRELLAAGITPGHESLYPSRHRAAADADPSWRLAADRPADRPAGR